MEFVTCAEGWKWAETCLPWDCASELGLARIYGEEADLSEKEAKEYDELAELANGEAMDEEFETLFAQQAA
ncbi:hypothetical protein [Solirhodobacter olei]|uniref:hypothetical protein n=1 Tax=Solirhodobacter olei TaxID=2493082 RepID=UPI000FD8E78F|nr:hypothetical protein [Solirhodobacter olei]